jgi:hypothetical protein
MRQSMLGGKARNSCFSWSLLVLLSLLVFPIICQAQDTGYISGTVTDKTGAAIVGADVTLTNLGDTLHRNTSTNDVGAYVIPGLPGDTYNLTVTAQSSRSSLPPKLS